MIVVVRDSLLRLAGLLLRRGHERLLHAEGVVQGGVVTGVVRMLTGHLVQSLRIEKDLVGSLRQENVGGWQADVGRTGLSCRHSRPEEG